ncbi:hypothetical protein AB0G04_26120 [Actinoplanes sp. NPDC023801]|uniref:hypothetical protein n=1 Tax=Actinoplanes sp. NPDC023801 TaxID=3154595 RepID=UPI0033F86B83
MIMNDEARTVRSRGERHRGPAGALMAFAVLLCLAGYTFADSAYLMSNNCFDDTGQIVCPAGGPGWLRPLPGYAVLAGVVAGFAGLAVGRPLRRPALVIGFGLVAAALICGRVLAV